MLHPRDYAKRGLCLDECVAGEVVRVAVERGWDIFSMPHDQVNDPAELRRLAEQAVAEQPRSGPYDPMHPQPTRLPTPPRRPHHEPADSSRVVGLLRSWRDAVLVGQDDETWKLRLRKGAPPERLTQFETSAGVPLPEEYLDFMATTDGLALGLFEIQSLASQAILSEHKFIRLVDWGNGDFDCLALEGSAFPHGSIVFCNHNPGVAVQVADSMLDWLSRLMQEHRASSGILHPRDYWVSRNYKGVYSHVCDALKGVDCELNR